MRVAFAFRSLLLSALTGGLLVACGDSGTNLPGAEPPNSNPDPSDTTDASGPVRIVGGASVVRAGDVHRFQVETDEGIDGTVVWRLVPQEAGILDQTGRFLGYQFQGGTAQVVATVQEFADTFDVTIQSRDVFSSVSVVGQSEVPLRGTTDLWVHGTTAYTGTRSRFFQNATRRGDALHTWDVSDPANPVMTSTLQVDAGTVNDIKVSADGRIGVVTHEGAQDQLNGITLLDLSNPLDPRPITRYTQGMENGVHNVWIDGDFLYAAAAPAERGLRLLIVDISDPANPVEAARYFAGSSILHDVYVRDGLAFLSHWDVGLVILDVGHGILGGSPQNPVEVSRLPLGGNTHNAWYWPRTGYVFVGEEDFNKPGILHVVDASDLQNPVEVANYSFGSVTPHNVWLDEERAHLYVSWYQGGLHVLDVSGELWGDLGLGGRRVAQSLYNNNASCSSFAPDCTTSWAPQLHDGLIYVSDVGSGLWVLEPNF